MSEHPNGNGEWTRLNDAWMRVGEAVGRTSQLYLKELAAYLDWAQSLQREVLDESIVVTQKLVRLGERQLAFWARLRDSVPAYGSVPKGTETVQGMVQAVVREAEHAAEGRRPRDE